MCNYSSPFLAEMISRTSSARNEYLCDEYIIDLCWISRLKSRVCKIKSPLRLSKVKGDGIYDFIDDREECLFSSITEVEPVYKKWSTIGLV